MRQIKIRSIFFLGKHYFNGTADFLAFFAETFEGSDIKPQMSARRQLVLPESADGVERTF